MPRIEANKTENDVLTAKTPQLFAWLASVDIVSLIILTQILPQRGNACLRGVGVFILVLAGLFIFWPFYLLTKHGSSEGPTYMQSSLVVDRGLYAVIRHPQYLGYILLACGFALLSQHRASILLAVVATALFYAQAVQEEVACLAAFGEPYARYCQRVPRFNVIVGLARLLRGEV